MALAERADVEALLGITADPARLDRVLDLASGAVIAEAQLQRFAKEDGDEIELPGVWGGELWLPQRPVLDVTEVRIFDPFLDVVLPAASYRWRVNGRLTLAQSIPVINALAVDEAGSWGGPDYTVGVKYAHGFDEIPSAVKFVTAVYAGRLYMSGGAMLGIQSETFDQSYTVSYAMAQEGIPDDLKVMLRPWKRLAHTIEV